MKCFVIPFLLIFALLFAACEDDLFDSDSDDDDYQYYSETVSDDDSSYDSSQTYTITVVSQRYDIVDVRLDGDYKGTLVMYGSRIGFTASGGEHTIQLWGRVGGLGQPWEDVLIAENTFVLNEDMVITIKPL